MILNKIFFGIKLQFIAEHIILVSYAMGSKKIYEAFCITEELIYLSVGV